MEIRGETDIAKTFLLNKSFRNEIYFSTTCDLLNRLNGVTDSAEKAKLLWNSYYDYVKRKSPHSFKPDISTSIDETCKLKSLQDNARFSQHSFTLRKQQVMYSIIKQYHHAFIKDPRHIIQHIW